MVFLAHGYQVDMVDRTAQTRLVRGHSMASVELHGARGNLKRVPSRMATLIKKYDGTPCFVGGKSVWKFDDSKYGIGGSLADWLSCAQVTLDSIEQGPFGPRHLRTNGLSLRLIFEYHNARHHEKTGDESTVCILTVDRFQGVATMLQPVYESLQIPTFLGGYASKHVKKVYGVAIVTRIAGRYWEFDFEKLLSTFVKMFVLFQIPSLVTRCLALYFFGQLSEIYRRARRTKLNVHSHFQDAIAKMMLAAMGFRGLMGGIWKGKSSEIDGLTIREWHTHMLDLFHSHIDSGAICERQLKHMAAVTFKHLDHSHSGKITCRDFIRSCSSHDTFDMDSLAQLLVMRKQLVSGVLDSAYIRMQRSLVVAKESDRRSPHEAKKWTETIASIAAANNKDDNTSGEADDDVFQDFGPQPRSNPDLHDFHMERLPSTDLFHDFHLESDAAMAAEDGQASGSSGVGSLMLAAGTSAQFKAVQQGYSDVLRRVEAIEDACIESRVAALEARHGMGAHSYAAAMAVDGCASPEPECERVLKIDDRLALINESKDPKSTTQPVDHRRQSVEEWEDKFKTQLEAERVARLCGQNTLASILGRQFENAMAVLEQRLAALESQVLAPRRLPAQPAPLSEPEAELPSQTSVGHQRERPVQSRIDERTALEKMVGPRRTEEVLRNSGNDAYVFSSPGGLMPLASKPLCHNNKGCCAAALEPQCSSRPLRSNRSSAGGTTAGKPQSPGPAPGGQPVPRIARGATTTLLPHGVLSSRRALSPRRLMSPMQQSAAANAATAVSTASAACGSSDIRLQPKALRQQTATDSHRHYIRSGSI